MRRVPDDRLVKGANLHIDLALDVGERTQIPQVAIAADPDRRPLRDPRRRGVQPVVELLGVAAHIDPGAGAWPQVVDRAKGAVRSCRQGEIASRRKGRLQPSQIGGAGLVRLVRNQDGDKALRPIFQIRPVEGAFGLAGAALAQGEQARESGIGRSIDRIDEHARPIDQIKPAANDQPYAGGLGRLMGAHDPGQRVAIHDGEGLKPEQPGLFQQQFATACAAQEGKVRSGLKLDV